MIPMTAGKIRDSRSWACTECAFEYDPQLGDAASGIAPGMAFVDLPADWRCPWCGAPKQAFLPVMAGGMNNRPEWD